VLKFSKSSKNKKIDWQTAPDILKLVKKLVKEVEFDWVNIEDLFFVRSTNAKTRAYARIWGLGRIWQIALDSRPKYIIEVISEKFDRLKEQQKEDVIIHELTHIPKNFSGALVPHIRKGKRNFHKKVHDYIKLKNKKRL